MRSEALDDDGRGAFGGALFVGEDRAAVGGEGEEGGEAGVLGVGRCGGGSEGSVEARGEEIGATLEEDVGVGAAGEGDGLGAGAEVDLGVPGAGEDDRAAALPDGREGVGGGEDRAAVHGAGFEEPGAGAEFGGGRELAGAGGAGPENGVRLWGLGLRWNADRDQATDFSGKVGRGRF